MDNLSILVITDVILYGHFITSLQHSLNCDVISHDFLVSERMFVYC